MSKDKDEQVKLAHQVIDATGCAKNDICVILLRYKVAKSESSYAEVRMCASQEEEETVQQIIVLNDELDNLFRVIDVDQSVSDRDQW